MRLTRLQQMGLAISACWVLGVTVYQRQTEMPKAQNYAMAKYFICAERSADAGNRDFSPCVQQVGRDWDKWMNRKWPKIARLALLPLAGGWVLGFACLRLYRRKYPGRQAGDRPARHG